MQTRTNTSRTRRCKFNTLNKFIFHAKAAARGGKRNGIYYRSRWEFNISLWLDELKRRGEVLEWSYEKHEFQFPVKKGTRFYKPDFWVREPDDSYFIEVKGFMAAKDITALARMARYHPEVKILIINKAKYAEISAEFGGLAGWEA